MGEDEDEKRFFSSSSSMLRVEMLAEVSCIPDGSASGLVSSWRNSFAVFSFSGHQYIKNAGKGDERRKLKKKHWKRVRPEKQRGSKRLEEEEQMTNTFHRLRGYSRYIDNIERKQGKNNDKNIKNKEIKTECRRG